MAEATTPNLRSIEEIVNDIAEKNLSAPATVGTVRIAAQRTDASIERLDAKIGQLYGTIDAKIDRVHSQLDSKIDRLDAKIDNAVTGLSSTITKEISLLRVDVMIRKRTDKRDLLQFTLSAVAVLAALFAVIAR